MEDKVRAIFEGLNDEQRDAVACIEGPVLIVAGAGSGKTRVLTSRIANILACGCEPDRILALTFTKKAAGEMKERISAMVGERKARRLYMGTFHSVFIRFLRDYADRIGYPANFTIYDTSDSTSAIKAILKELKLDDKTYKPKNVLSRISMAKNNLCTAARYKADAVAMANDQRSKTPRIGEIYELYDRKLRQSGVMDFDDILLNMNILLRDHPDALKEIADRFDYLMVDEYQDTNYAQYVILKKLSQWHRKLCVVGDDSQSIYAFRGAKVENILNFKKDFPEARIFRLERNYRSTKTIVDAANSLIANNENRIPKNCYATGETGEKIALIRADNENDEAKRIAGSIVGRIRSASSQYKDFAILYRTNSQSRALEEALRGYNIPYIIYSGNAFFDRAEVKDLMAYFKLVVNQDDDESFKRVVNKPARGIGDTTINALAEVAKAHQSSLYKAITIAEQELSGIKSAGLSKLIAFRNLIAPLSERLDNEDALSLASAIVRESGLEAFYKSDSSVEGQARLANIGELISNVASYVENRQNDYIEDLQAEGNEYDDSETELPLIRLDEYLENISLLSTVDMTDEEDASNRVSMMTVHSAKGLEFKHVYVVGMEQNLFPSSMMTGSLSEIEEERRLFYVAMTRAKESLDLSFASSRMRNGQHEFNRPSVFLKEIDPQYLDHPLTEEDYSASEESYGFSFGRGSYSGRGSSGGFGSSAGFGRSSGQGYGRSGAVQYEKRQPSPAVKSASPSRVESSSRAVSGVSNATSSRVAAPSRAASGAVLKDRYDAATFIANRITDFAAGQRIEHLRFGPGQILSLEGNFPDVKARIQFDDFPEPKIIMLKYSKVRIIR